MASIRADTRRMKIITDQRCTSYFHPGHPERPERIKASVQALRAQTTLPIAWVEPGPVEDAQIRRAHAAHHLARLALPLDFDSDTPAYEGILEHARRSVGGALTALQLALKGEWAFSLLRPPGHHATQDRAMGFCYLNSVAIAALEALNLKKGKVAVFDFDVHHGNGTEAILLGRADCAYLSVHQFPAYPGTGSAHHDNAFNYPVLPGAPHKDYRAALAGALDRLKQFKPAVVGVSAGFDAFRGDPLSDAPLEVEDYHWLGQSLRGLGVPTYSVLEGGYSGELPSLILAYLRGLAGQ